MAVFIPPTSPKGWWQKALPEVKRALRAYRDLERLMRKKRLTKREIQKAISDAADASEFFLHAGGSLEEMERLMRFAEDDLE